jgi:hypothetical protein
MYHFDLSLSIIYKMRKKLVDPAATAVASLELWNSTSHRNVHRLPVRGDPWVAQLPMEPALMVICGWHVYYHDAHL